MVAIKKPKTADSSPVERAPSGSGRNLTQSPRGVNLDPPGVDFFLQVHRPDMAGGDLDLLSATPSGIWLVHPKRRWSGLRRRCGSLPES
ncbi:unnamed protein product [Cuscuta campestris]|uniref:Uncharacterized protein n=1 Tax=Cuscuta campestris TaxID=132261 RepID=A0A484LZK6_9ASTE|nr:unnamed protein product [Cuscuta campestris]